MTRALKVTGKILLRGSCGLLGLVGLALGIAMCMTIILFIPGMIALVGAFGLLAYACIGTQTEFFKRHNIEP